MTILQGEGQITGFNDLILGLAKERSIDAMYILGEIDNNPNIIQPKNSRGSFTNIDKKLGISSMNILELEDEKRKKFMEHQMSYLEKVMENGEHSEVSQ